MTKEYKSEIAAAVHETAEGLYAVGAIDKKRMRDYDEWCLAPVETLSPDEIRSIREQEDVPQRIFARYMNVSKNLISDWECGKRRPGGPALRLLTIVQKKGLQAIL